VLSFLRRPRVLVPLGLVAAALVALIVAAARSGTPGCSVPAPEVNLPEQLKVLGEFDQPFDATDTQGLQQASIRAATALHSDLAGATAETPVSVAADPPARHDAVVVPLTQSGGDSGAPPRIAGLVAYLRDCGGRAWYGDVDDLLHTDPGPLPTAFPGVGRAAAATQLGSGDLRLVWRDTPFQPLWLDPRTRRTVAAGPPRG